MDDIEVNLDEKILIQEKRKYIIILHEKLFLFIFLFYLSMISVCSYLLIILISRIILEGIFSFMIIIIFFILGFFIIGPLLMLDDHFKTLKRDYRREKLKDLKYYENCYVLTNKRWIEKSQEFFDLDYREFVDYSVEKREDVIYIDLSRVYAVYHVSEKSHFSVFFKFNPEREELFIGSTIPFDKSLDIMKKLENILDFVEKKEENWGTSYFLRKTVN